MERILLSAPYAHYFGFDFYAGFVAALFRCQ
jgi:hypothetical protein